jgi:hypothetical protein
VSRFGRLLLLLAALPASFARAEEVTLPELLSVRAEGAPAIDGVAEAAWDAAPRLVVGAAPALTVRSLHTDEAIWFLAEWEDEGVDRAPEASHQDGLTVALLVPGSNSVAVPMTGWTADGSLAGGAGTWKEGRWTVELGRPRAPQGAGDIAVVAQTPLVADLSTTSAMRLPGHGGHGRVRIRLVRSAKRWTFDDCPAGSPPPGFESLRTGGGPRGEWRIEAPEGDPGRHLLQASDEPTSYRFPLLLTEPSFPADVRASVRFLAVSGQVDQAAGIALRAAGADDYLLVRANALEGNIRVYRIEGGKRQMFAGVELAVTAGEWHTLSLEARGEAVRVAYDGETVIEAEDGGIRGPGRAGLWTKADSVTRFDDFEVTEEYPPPP